MPTNNPSIAAFQIEQQLMSQWCWAAVAVSVRRCYDAQFLQTQREFVSRMLRNPVCKQSSSVSCNKRFSLQIALQALDVFHEKIEDVCSATEIITEISNGRPIGCQLIQNGFDGHYVVIKGASGTGSSLKLEVSDPLDGVNRFVTLQELLFDYHDSQWEQTFFTKMP